MSYNNTLQQDLFSPEINKAGTRDGFGEGIVLAGEENKNIVALCADLTESVRVEKFKEKFPERFFEVGIAEQNMMGIAAGLALSGKIPFATSYAEFSPGRNWEQLRVSVSYSKANVKVASSHAGLTVGPDGATHQNLEDIALTRVLPNITVIVPCDFIQAKKATLAISKLEGPCYLRLGRSATPIFTTEQTDFEIGKAQILKEGKDITIVTCGYMVYRSLKAAQALIAENIDVEVINLHTIKPLDKETILNSLKKTNKLLTVEEHQLAGGMGSAVLEAIASEYQVKTQMVGVNDTFGESGEADELFDKYGLSVENIINKAKLLLN